MRLIIKKKLIKRKALLIYKKDIIFYKKSINTCLNNFGLAINSNQIGNIKNMFLVIKNKSFYVFRNTFILWRSIEKKSIIEGCLSLNKSYEKIRNKFIKVVVNERKFFLNNFTCICFQHEIDHNYYRYIDKN